MAKRLFSMAVVLAFAFSISFVPASFAGEQSMGDYASAAGNKFMRGAVNTVTSPAEIYCGVSKEMKSGAQKRVAFFKGLGNGFVTFVNRFLVGVTDMVTFVIPTDGEIAQVCEGGK